MCNLTSKINAGNRIREAKQVEGLQECPSLEAVSLARNELTEIQPLLQALHESHLAIFDVKGNPIDSDAELGARYLCCAVYRSRLTKRSSVHCR